jgi:L-fuconolactonase
VIVDAHHHLWDPAARAYDWMTGAFAPLRRRYGTAELRAVAEPLGIAATVVVQAAASEEETAELLALAAAPGSPVRAVVGWIDLTDPAAGERLAALRAGPGGERLAGIRHLVQDEPDPAWLARPGVLRGLRALAAAGMRYDLLLRPAHLPAALVVAEQVPELALVVDHGAKPDIAAGGWEPWSSGLAALAAHPRVHCKLSGLATEARWDAWREDGVERYAARLLELFGPDRLMFGSDWPVCTLAASYREVLELALATVAELGDGERAAVMGGTASRFYGLG